MVEETDKEKDDVLRQKRAGQKRYVFDVVFGEDSTQVCILKFENFNTKT